MGILDNLGDKAVEKFTGKETIRIPCEQMVQIVNDIFIAGADEEQLDYILKIAKGMWYKKDGKSLFNITSDDGRYVFKVVKDSGSKKQVWVEDNSASKFYQLDKDKDWKKFYQAVDTAIKMKKINALNITASTAVPVSPVAENTADVTAPIETVKETVVAKPAVEQVDNSAIITPSAPPIREEHQAQATQQAVSQQTVQQNQPTASQSTQYQNVQASQMSAPYQPVSAPPTKSASGTASLVLGIVSMILWLLPILGLPSSVVGLVLGISAKRKNAQGMAVAGIVFSSIGLFLTIINGIMGAMMA